MQENHNDKKEKKNILVPILVFIIIILLALLCFKSCGVEDGVVSDNKFDLQVDPNATDTPTYDVGVSEGEIAIPGGGSITIPANKTDVIVDFFNPIENKDMYYLTFELCLVDDSEQGYEVLYTSGLCEPGSHIQNITLSRPMERGRYEAFIHVQPYTMDESHTKTNNANMKTELVVK